MPQPFGDERGSCRVGVWARVRREFPMGKITVGTSLSFRSHVRALVEMNDPAVGPPAPKGALIGLFLAGSHRDFMFRLGN